MHVKVKKCIQNFGRNFPSEDTSWERQMWMVVTSEYWASFSDITVILITRTLREWAIIRLGLILKWFCRNVMCYVWIHKWLRLKQIAVSVRLLLRHFRYACCLSLNCRRTTLTRFSVCILSISAPAKVKVFPYCNLLWHITNIILICYSCSQEQSLKDLTANYQLLQNASERLVIIYQVSICFFSDEGKTNVVDLPIQRFSS